MQLRRSAYSQSRVDVLEGSCGVLVKLEVRSLRSGPERFQVRLVPHLEKPLRHFTRAVTIGAVLPQPADKTAPLLEIPWPRDVPSIVKDRPAARRQCGRH